MRKIAEAETLRELHVAAAFPISLDELIDAPLDFGGRTFPAAAEILVVLDLELTDVLFDLAQVFVNGAHAWKMPPNLHARSMEQNRQPEEWSGDSNPLPHGTAPSWRTGGRWRRDCRAGGTVLKCPHGNEREEDGFGRAGGAVAADSVGGRIAGTAASGGAFETSGPRLVVEVARAVLADLRARIAGEMVSKGMAEFAALAAAPDDTGRTDQRDGRAHPGAFAAAGDQRNGSDSCIRIWGGRRSRKVW